VPGCRGGQGYDQLDATGTVTLNGATLNVSFGTTKVPVNGSVTIIQAASVVGTFAQGIQIAVLSAVNALPELDVAQAPRRGLAAEFRHFDPTERLGQLQLVAISEWRLPHGCLVHKGAHRATQIIDPPLTCFLTDQQGVMSRGRGVLQDQVALLVASQQQGLGRRKVMHHLLICALPEEFDAGALAMSALAHRLRRLWNLILRPGFLLRRAPRGIVKGRHRSRRTQAEGIDMAGEFRGRREPRSAGSF
jgi:hypothetical protein